MSNKKKTVSVVKKPHNGKMPAVKSKIDVVEAASNGKLVKAPPDVAKDVTSFLHGKWDTVTWFEDTDSRYWDIIQKFYRPQDAHFYFPFGVYDEALLKNTHLQSAINSRVSEVTSTPSRLVPAADNFQARKRMEFVAKVLDRIGLSDSNSTFAKAINDIQKDGIYFPFSIAEINWDYENGRIFPVRINARHPKNFGWKEDGRTPYFLGKLNQKVFMDPGKYLVYSPLRERDHPYIGGLARQVYHVHRLYILTLKWWGLITERGGIPIIVVQGSENFDGSEQAIMVESLENLKNNIYLLVPTGVDVQAFESKMKAASATAQDLADFCKLEISKAILGETLTAEQGSNAGSYGLGSVHEKTKSMYVRPDAYSLMDLINKTLIPLIIQYNFPPVEKDNEQDWLCPKFIIECEPPVDLQQRLLITQGVYNLGVPISIKAVRTEFNIVEPVTADDTITRPAATPSLGQLPSQNPADQAQPGDSNREKAPGQDELNNKSSIDTNKGRGKREAPLAAEAHKIYAAVSDFSTETLHIARVSYTRPGTFGNAVVKEGKKFIGGIEDAVSSWVSSYESLDDLYRDLSYGIQYDEHPLGKFNSIVNPDRTFLENFMFQGYVLGYTQLTTDPRLKNIKAAAGDEDTPLEIATENFFEPKRIMELFDTYKILEKKDYEKITAAMKMRSFTAAGKLKEDLFNIIKPLIAQGIMEGWTVAQFKEKTRGIFTSAHAEVIFRTNIATVYETARADAVFDPDIAGAFPGAYYYVVLDERTTEICRGFAGKIVTVSELLRGPMVPPFHWNCRTILVYIHESEWGKVKAEDLWSVSDMMNLPREQRPLADFGYYEPILKAS